MSGWDGFGQTQGTLTKIAPTSLNALPKKIGQLWALQRRIKGPARAAVSRWLLALKRAVLQSLKRPNLCHHQYRSLRSAFGKPSATLEGCMAHQVPTLARHAVSGGKVGAVDFAMWSSIGSLGRMHGSRIDLHGGQAQQLLLFVVLQLY